MGRDDQGERGGVFDHASGVARGELDVRDYGVVGVLGVEFAGEVAANYGGGLFDGESGEAGLSGKSGEQEGCSEPGRAEAPAAEPKLCPTSDRSVSETWLSECYNRT